MPENNPQLFAWETDDMPELQCLILILEHLPYQEIVAKFKSQRGCGRSDYPIRALFRSMIAGVAFGHDSVNSAVRTGSKHAAGTTLRLQPTAPAEPAETSAALR